VWSSETLINFVGVPLAVTLAIYGLVYVVSGRKGKRYRPGRPFLFAPVWFTSAASASAAASPRPAAELPAPAHPELTGGHVGAFGGPTAEFESTTGGASDSW
jgi:hypothetical protein